jgi:hypothetical protein
MRLKIILHSSLFLWLSLISMSTAIGHVYAACCVGCIVSDCTASPPLIPQEHTDRLPDIQENTSDQFGDHKDWVTDDFLKDRVATQLQKIANNLTNVGMNQIYRVGTFFDAKHQMESQRLTDELALQAHKDYQPSESFCTFGTAVRSMAHTESAAKTAAMAMNRRQMSRHLGTKNIGGSNNRDEDEKNRWNNFLTTYCDPQDNHWVDGKADSGLTSICGASGGGDTDRINIDVDFTRLIENNRTFDLYGGVWVGSGDELDIIALGNNLYGHNVLTRNLSESNIYRDELASLYMELRSVAAKRSVAENSYNAIVGLKSQGSTGLSANTSETNKYLGKILQDLGIPEDEVVKYLGLDPSESYIGNDGADASYFATLEILAKKIYQNPEFYSNLYDTPANIKRKAAALKAIELMLDRTIFESQLRQEMAMSVLLSSRLSGFAEEANADIGRQ